MLKRLFALALLAVAPAALAAGNVVMPIEVSASGNDSVGRQLSYFIQQDLSASSTMRLTDSNELRIRLSLITLDADRQSPGYETVYSVVWTWINPKQAFPLFLNQSVGYCGEDRVQQCAETIVADTQSESDSVIRLIIQGSSQH